MSRTMKPTIATARKTAGGMAPRCGRPMVSSGGTCGDAYCAASPVTLDFPPSSSPAHDPDITVREACRRRMKLDGADAQALEHALTITERERDAALAEVERLRARRPILCRHAWHPGTRNNVPCPDCGKDGCGTGIRWET